MIYIDESAAPNGSILVVAALLLPPALARRVVERFRRKHRAWTDPELKGSRMADELQLRLLHEAAKQEGVAAAVMVADGTCLPHIGWAFKARREHEVYAAMVAEALRQLHQAGAPVHQVVADTGRYPSPVMRQLPGVIDRHGVQLGLPPLPASPGPNTVALTTRLQFAESQGHHGLQIVDVLANRALRTLRSPIGNGAPGPQARLNIPITHVPATLLPVPPGMPVLPPPAPVILAIP